MKYLKVNTDFVQSIEMLSDAEKGRLFRAMLIYAKTGEEPTLNGSERFVWPIAKSNIDSQRKTYDTKIESLKNANKYNPNHNGKPMENHQLPYGNEWESIENHMEEKREENERVKENTSERKKEPKKENTLRENEKAKEESKRNTPPSIPPTDSDLESLFGYNQYLLEVVSDWFTYKKERRETYKPIGRKMLLSKIQNKVSEYGEDAVVNVMRESMASNYQGIVWDWLTQNKRTSGKKTTSFYDLWQEEKKNDQGTDFKNSFPY